MDDGQLHAVSKLFIGRAMLRRLVTGFPDSIPGQVICGEQSGTGAGFLRVLGFLLPILIPPIAPLSSSIIQPHHLYALSL
jgi:hypothetical protein